MPKIFVDGKEYYGKSIFHNSKDPFIEKLEKTATHVKVDSEGLEIYEAEPHPEEEMKEIRFELYKRKEVKRQKQIKEENNRKQNIKKKQKNKKNMVKKAKRRNRK